MTAQRVLRNFARVLTLGCLGLAAAGVVVPMGARIGTFKYNIGYSMTHGRAPFGSRQLSGDEITVVGDHTLNLLMLLPLTFLAALGWPTVSAWVWGLAATVLGITSETAQWLLPQLGRRPLVWNTVENAVGGWIGIGIALALRRLAGHDGEHPTGT